MQIGQKQKDEANRIKLQIAKDKRDFDVAQGDLNRQNQLAIQIKKGEQKLAEIEKAELKVGKEFRTDQVRPAFENVVAGLTATYAEKSCSKRKTRFNCI